MNPGHNNERRVSLGKIVGVHGVRGWLKIESHTEPRLNIFRYRPWILTHRGREWLVEEPAGREQGRGMLAHWNGLETRDQAEALVGAEILAARSALPPAAPDEYYWADLEGLQVRGLDGYDFGRVSHLLATGANDVLSVLGDRERLIPFLQGSVVRSIDLEAGLILVDWDPDF